MPAHLVTNGTIAEVAAIARILGRKVDRSITSDDLQRRSVLGAGQVKDIPGVGLAGRILEASGLAVQKRRESKGFVAKNHIRSCTFNVTVSDVGLDCDTSGD